MVRVLIAGLASTFVVAAHAAECGSSLRRPDIARLAAAARDSNTNLLQHIKSLTLEWQTIADGGISSAKVRSELDKVRFTHDYSRELQHSLARAELLTQLRDSMRDTKDKQATQSFLSIAASATRELNETVRESVGELLTSATRPGIAVDISRLRDLANETAKLFGNCTLPKGLSDK